MVLYIFYVQVPYKAYELPEVFPRFCGLSFHVLNCAPWSLLWLFYLFFLLWLMVLVSHLRNHWLHPRSWRFTPIVLGLTFRFLIHFELIFFFFWVNLLYFVRKSPTSFFCMLIATCVGIICWKDYESSWQRKLFLNIALRREM